MEKKLFKRLFSMCIVIAMVLSMCPTFVFAEDTTDYSGYTYVAFGDSITYGIDGDYSSGEEGYRMEKPYPTLVAETLGIGTVVNQAKSGATWTQHESRTNMTDRIMRYNGAADIISVMLGVNDYAAKCTLGDMNSRDNTTIYGSIHMAAKHLTTTYPDAFIFFMTPFKYRTEDNGKYTLSDVAQAVKDVAAVYNIPVLDMYTNGQFDPATGAKDQIHPTQAHHINYTAPMICEFIKQHNAPASKDACPCDACDGADATWIAWDGAAAFENGKHYRLAADVQLTGMITIPKGTTVVLDLNGKTITAAANSRCFEVSGELAIVNSTADTDADGNYTGLITGGVAATNDTDNVLRGGNINIEKGTSSSNPGGTLKLYGGTIANGQAPNAGGNVKVGKFAKFYMYGGSIMDGTASTSGAVGNGGNMNVDNGAYFYMYGGTISGGTASASGGNIYSWKGTINLYDGLITGGKANANSSNRGGGNIWLNAANAKLNMYGGVISDGEAKRFGGNIYLDNASGKITMEGGVISGGKTTQHGGNIYASAGTVQMTGGVIKDGKANWDAEAAAHTAATNDGGNLYLSGAKAYFGGNAEVTGGSAGTATNQFGGNIYMTSAAELYLQDQAQITSGSANDGKNIYAMTDAKVTMYGGTVKNGSFKTADSGFFHMYGGQIEDLRWVSSGTQETVIYNGIVGSNTSGLPEKLATWAADCATVTQTTHVEGHTVYAVYQTSLTNGACATCGHTYSAANCGTCKPYSHPAVKVANCEFCNEDVVWAPMLGNELVADHYYLAEDVALTGKIGLAVGDAVCIDLNGHNLTTADVTTGITLTSALLNITNTGADASAIISGGGGILAANKASGELRPVINFKNVTVTGGRSIDNGGNLSTNAVDLILDNCTISGGYAPKNGGNVCCYATNLTIKGNTRITSGFAGNNGDDLYLGTTAKAQMYSGTVGDICQLNSTGSFHLYDGTVGALRLYNYTNSSGNYNSSFYMYGGTVNDISLAGKNNNEGAGVIALYAGTVGTDPRTANNKNTTMVATCSCLIANADGTYTIIHTEGSTPCAQCAANDVYVGGYTFPAAFVGEHNYPENWTEGKMECAGCGNVLNCGHASTTLTDDREATCLEPGYTGDYVCDECGTITQSGTAIDQLEHNYTYTPNGDKTHTVTCDKGCNENTVADCTDEDGDKLCDDCGDKLTDPVVIVYGVSSSEEFESLQEAIDASEEGCEYWLQKDIILTERLTIDKNAYIKLNGFSITGNFDDAFGMIYVKKGVYASFNNGTIENAGGIAIGNYGFVELGAEATATGADAAIYNFYYQADYYGIAVVNGKANVIWNCGNLTVSESAVVDYLDNSGAAAISGTVTELYAQDGSDCPDVEGAGTLTIADPSNVTIDDGFLLWEVEEGVYKVHAHAHENVGYTDPTNTENGYWTYTCECGDSYVVADEGTMLHFAINETTGESYADLQAALSAAAKGETVKLLKDAEAEDIYVGAGRTLDLNGKKLTVTSSISAAYTTTHIIDSSNGEGLLVVDGAAVSFNKKNEQLPVWTAEGVKFVQVAYKQKVEAVADDASALKYRFYFDVADDSILPELLTEDCLTIRIKVNYTTASGMNAYQYFELPAELVQQYAAKWPNGTVDLILRGAADLESLSFTAEIVSTAPNGSSVVIGSTPYSV